MNDAERRLLDQVEEFAARRGLRLGPRRAGDPSTDRLRVTAHAPDGARLQIDLAEADRGPDGRPGRYWYGLVLPDAPRGPLYIGYHLHGELEQPGEGDLPHRVVRVDGVRAHWRREPRALTPAEALERLFGDRGEAAGHEPQERLRPEPGETWRAFRRRKNAAARAA
jgi:hypothetical protein